MPDALDDIKIGQKGRRCKSVPANWQMPPPTSSTRMPSEMADAGM